MCDPVATHALWSQCSRCIASSSAERLQSQKCGPTCKEFAPNAWRPLVVTLGSNFMAVLLQLIERLAVLEHNRNKVSMPLITPEIS
jgi:hypothetical protein